MTCAGGDNNLGLVMTDHEVTSEKPPLNGDVIVGRKSSAFIVKVSNVLATCANVNTVGCLT